MKKIILSLTLLSFPLLAQPAFASQVVINDVNTGSYGDGYAQCGVGVQNVVTKWPSGTLYATSTPTQSIIKFDLSSIPQDAIINSASLSYFPTFQFNNPTISIDRVNKDVDLDYFTANNYSQTGKWDSPCMTDSPWFQPRDIAGFPMATISNITTNSYNTVNLDTSEVQTMLANNYGIFIRSHTGGVFFNSANQNNPAYLTVTYNNPHSITPLENGYLHDGDTYSSNGSIYDTDATSFTATVDYGDGSGIQPLSVSGNTFNLSHTYNSVGDYIVTVNVTDNNSVTMVSTGKILVYPSPYVYGLSDQTLNEGDTYSANVAIFDLDSNTAILTVDFGDGSGIQPLSHEGSGYGLHHQYKDNGNYIVTVEAVDGAGNIFTQSATITVNNLTPFVGPLLSVNPSTTIVGTNVDAEAFFIDAGILDTHTATIDWGDGSSPTSATVNETVAPSGDHIEGHASGTHSYTNSGNFTIKIAVKDKDGAYASGSGTVTIAKQITSLSPATVYISKGLLTSNHFNLKAEVYKDTTLVATGELNDFNPPTSSAPVLATIPFNDFTPVDFPAGSALKLKLSACSATGLLTGTAKLHYNASNVDSKFGATIGNTSATYHLLANSILGTTVGNSAQTVTAKSKCTTFTSFGTWTVTP